MNGFVLTFVYVVFTISKTEICFGRDSVTNPVLIMGTS